jgi:hypothetical protein
MVWRKIIIVLWYQLQMQFCFLCKLAHPCDLEVLLTQLFPPSNPKLTVETNQLSTLSIRRPSPHHHHWRGSHASFSSPHTGAPAIHRRPLPHRCRGRRPRGPALHLASYHSFALGQHGLPLPPQPLPPRPHYRKSHSCHEPSVLPWPFCRAHGKIVFCRRPDLKLTADRAAHGKKGCREGLSANKYFVVSFLWPTTAWYFAQSSSWQRDVLSWVFFLADDKMIFAINWNQISK